MSSSFERKDILIVVKTYPVPSKKSIETVCTAGITDKGEWIRLYPVRYRYLREDQQYKLFTTINASVKKNSKDFRPESYNIDEDSIKVIGHLDSNKHLIQRQRWLLPLVKKSIEEIEEAYHKNNTSLAIFKPKEIIDFIVEEDDKDWTDSQKASLGQTCLFDQASNEEIKSLKKVPYKFRCKFKCDDPNCKGHTLKIAMWDFNWAFFAYYNRYGSETEALKKLRDKWLSYFNADRDCYLIVGTTLPYDSFLIIGTFSIKRPIERAYQTSFLGNI